MHFLIWIFAIAYYVQTGQCDTNNTQYLIGCGKLITLSALSWAHLDVAIDTIPESDIPKFESTLGKLFCFVFERATQERLGQSNTRRTLNFTSELCQIEVGFNMIQNHSNFRLLKSFL